LAAAASSGACTPCAGSSPADCRGDAACLATQRAAHVEALGAPASLSAIVALGTSANSSAAAPDHFAHDDFARSELHGERSALGFVRALFSGVAQAYLVGGGDAWWSGLLVALAIALSSPLLCVLVLVASAIGLCTALLLGASPDESVANGLYVVCKCGAAGRGGMMLYTRPS
jgi:urea transporter